MSTRTYAKRTTTVKFTEERENESSFADVLSNVVSVLTRQAMRMLGQNPDEFLSVELLALDLLRYVADGKPLFGVKDHPRRHRVTGEEIGITSMRLKTYMREGAQKAISSFSREGDAFYMTGAGLYFDAARHAVKNFSRSTYDRLQSRGETVGRSKSYTYDDYLATLGMSVAAASRALGLSRPTIYKMRSEYSDTVNADTGEVSWYEPEEGFAGADAGRRPETDESSWFSPSLGAETEYAADHGGDVFH